MISKPSRWPIISVMGVVNLATLYVWATAPQDVISMYTATYPTVVVDSIFIGFLVREYRLNSMSIYQLWPILEFANDHRTLLESFNIHLPKSVLTGNLWRTNNVRDRWRSRKIFLQNVRENKSEIFQLIREIAYLNITSAIASQSR